MPRTNPGRRCRKRGAGTGPTIGLLGNFGRGNLGNDASLLALHNLLLSELPDARVECLCPAPEWVAARLGISGRAVRGRIRHGETTTGVRGFAKRALGRADDLSRAYRESRSFDILLVPGTGIFDDFGGARATAWPLLVWAWLVAGHRAGVKTGLVAVGAGPLDHPLSRKLVAAAARVCAYRSFRDDDSKAFVTELGVSTDNDPVVPDLAFSLPGPPGRPRPGERRLIAVAVMAYRGWSAGSDHPLVENYIRALAQTSTWLITQGYDVRLICADVDDAPAVDAVQTEVLQREGVMADGRLEVAVADDFGSLMELVADATAVIATRYHSVIAALVAGRPTLSIGYAAKNEALTRLVGLRDYYQSADLVDSDLLQKQLAQMIDEERDISARLADVVQGLRRQWSYEAERIVRSVSGCEATPDLIDKAKRHSQGPKCPWTRCTPDHANCRAC